MEHQAHQRGLQRKIKCLVSTESGLNGVGGGGGESSELGKILTGESFEFGQWNE